MDLNSLLDEEEDTFEDVDSGSNGNSCLQLTRLRNGDQQISESKSQEDNCNGHVEQSAFDGSKGDSGSRRKERGGIKRRKPSSSVDQQKEEASRQKNDQTQRSKLPSFHHQQSRKKWRGGYEPRSPSRNRAKRQCGNDQEAVDRRRFEKLKEQVRLHTKLRESYRSILNAPKDLLKILPTQHHVTIPQNKMEAPEEGEEEEEGLITEEKPQSTEEEEEGAIEEAVQTFSEEDVKLLASRICEVLDEKKVETMQEAIRQLGVHLTMELLDSTLEIEKCGGMLTADKTKRRATGGVFFTFMKEKVGKEVYKDIMGVDKKIKKKIQQQFSSYVTEHSKESQTS
mmetsp:Transcript_19477/g.25157  ORF Transcript_19477/g.25157 Transcript_19477/m.25157 type:complete len:340 (+) Transcript_19477:207-1226(+)|eukprot:CAMPEP_0117794534 /NCGR_PEP_ID=MMETSP0948-20121206/10746_1 /TAXON_ID=44440 /ORGANISM="Chattonella subsalsa, Strain CCMP2191" /LENGTH=339 /DNA_ID=CAMNT_0005625269 /DNA_START=114 /DNA_END=1133 /DNA_ORIENTATION=+